MGILLQLYIRNLLCPCCINIDDRTAHQAIRSIQTSCRYVILYPLQQQQQPQQSNGTSTNNFLTNLFGSTATTSTINTSKTHPSNIREPQRARLVLQDSDVDGQPILCITPIESNVETNNDMDGETSTNDNTTTNIVIKLRRIDKIQLDGNQIVIYTKKKNRQPQKSSQSPSTSSSMSMEVLRFSIIDPSSIMINTEDNDNNNETMNRTSHSTVTSNDNNIVFISSDIRNSLVHHWMVLIEWERQRCIKVQSSRTGNNTMNNKEGNDSDTDDDDDDETINQSNTNFITRHAQKVKHYAQREIELQRMKRQREQRKSQLILQTGGLKYTALAMATSTSSSMTSSSP